MNETKINWLRDSAMATNSKNDPRIIGQLETLAAKDSTAARMVHRYRSGGEDWIVKKQVVCIKEIVE